MKHRFTFKNVPFLMSILFCTQLYGQDFNQTFTGSTDYSYTPDGSNHTITISSKRMNHVFTGGDSGGSGFQSTTTASINLIEDRIFAIKFIGDKPGGSGFDSQFHLNTSAGTNIFFSWGGQTGEYTTANGNTVVYWDLYNGSTAYKALVDAAVADQISTSNPNSSYEEETNYFWFRHYANDVSVTSYSIDWIQAFTTTTDMENAAEGMDDGTGDDDETTSCPETVVSTSFDIGSGSVSGSEAQLPPDIGASVTFSPVAGDAGDGTWSWTGPNSFTASTREISVSSVTDSDYGIYQVSYENNCGTITIKLFVISFAFPENAGYVQAEDWTTTFGTPGTDVRTETTTDSGGGSNASYLDAGDWIEYSVDVPSSGSYSFEYRIANNNGSDGSYTLSLDGVGDLETVTFANTGGWQNWSSFSTGVPVNLTAGVQTWRVTINSNKTNFNWFRFTKQSIVWDGETSSDWNTATNWEGGVLPTSTDNVTIANVATAPVITSAVTLNAITIESGASLTVSSSSLTVANATKVNGALTIASGASFVPSGAVIGEVTFNRNTRYSDGKYSFVGSPVIADASIVGANLGSISYSYDETEDYSDLGGNRWVDASATMLMPGMGYAQALQGPISFTGVPNAGDVVVEDLTYTAGVAGEQGWNLLSNPYGAAINVETFLNNNAGIDNSISLWDDGGSATGGSSNSDYLAVNSIGSTSGTNGGSFNGYIGSMQGFFVKVAAEGLADVTFTETMRVADSNGDANFFRKANNNEVLNIKLAITSNSGFYNETLIGLRDDATSGIDRMYDAAKLIGNPNISFYSLIEDSKYAIQGLPIEAGISTELAFNLAEASQLTLSVEELSGLEDGMAFYLTDKETGKFYDLSIINSFEFSAAAGFDQNRFTLAYREAGILSNKLVNDQPIYRYLNNQLMVNFEEAHQISGFAVYDLSGKIILEKSFASYSSNELMIPISNQGINIIKIVTSEGTFTRKFLF